MKAIFLLLFFITSFACADEAALFARQLLRRRASAPKRIGVPYREVALAP